MGLDLFNKQVLDTYDAIIKVGDNNTLTGTPKRLSDGRGNDAPIYLGTSTMGIGITPSSGVTFEVNGLTKLTSVNITGSITNGVTIVGQTVTDSLKFTGGTGTQGTLSWNADEETLDLVNNGAVLQLGQEIHIHVRNNSVTTAIPNGTPVYVAGTLGASGRLKVAPMIADGSIAPEYFIGVTTEEIEADGDGKVTFLGKVRGFDTSGYTEGSKLYVSETVAGGWQTTEPTAPHPKLEVAFTVNSTNNGTLFVRSQNGHYLTDTHDIEITSVADKDLLVYDSTNGIWKNSKTLGAITTGDITISDGVGSGTISYDNGQNAFELSKGIKLQAGVGSFNNHIFSVGDPLYLTSQSGFEPMYLGASRVESTYFRATNGFQIGTSTVIDLNKNASLNDATLTGVLKGPSTLYIDPLPIDTYGDATVDTGKVVILGDLEVTGQTTTVNSTEVTINDKNLLLGYIDVVKSFDTNSTSTTLTLNTGDLSGVVAGMGITGSGIPADTTVVSITDATHIEISNAATATATGVSMTFAMTSSMADGAGITIGGADATLTYASATDDFTFNKPLNLSIGTDNIGITIDSTDAGSYIYFKDNNATDYYLGADGGKFKIINSSDSPILQIDSSKNATFYNNVTATTFIGALTGNADTASKWTTARTLTIGDTGKSVDGSANVSWSKTEIGFTLDDVTQNNGSTNNDINLSSTGSTFPSHYYHNLYALNRVYSHAFPSGYDHQANGATRYHWRASDGVSSYNTMIYEGTDGRLTVDKITSGAITIKEGSSAPNASAYMASVGLGISNVDGNLDLLSYDDDSTISNSIGFGRFSQVDGSIIHKFGITSWANTGSQGSNTGDKLSFNYGTSANVWGNTELFSVDTSGNLNVSGSGEFTNYLRITNTAGVQRLLMGNQDSSGANNPSIIVAANGNTYIGGGDSWDNNGGTIDYIATFSDSGNIGFGLNSSISARLHIKGDGWENNKVGSNLLRIESTDTVGAGLSLKNTTGNYWTIVNGDTAAWVGEGALNFVWSNGIDDATAPMMTLHKTGKLGIGTGAGTPSKRLHVKTTENEGIFLEGTSGGVWFDFKSSVSDLWSMGALGVDGFGIYNRTDSLYALRINNDRNFGLNLAPTSTDRLYVDGNIKVKTNKTDSLNSSWYSATDIRNDVMVTNTTDLYFKKLYAAGTYSSFVYYPETVGLNFDLSFKLTLHQNSSYRHFAIAIASDGSDTTTNFDFIVFRHNVTDNTLNQIRIDVAGVTENSLVGTSIPNFADGSERHILIQVRNNKYIIEVDGSVIHSFTASARTRSSGVIGYSIYEASEADAYCNIRQFEITQYADNTHTLPNTKIEGGLTIEGSIDSGGSDYGYYQSAGTNIVLKGDSSGRSGIFFQSEKDATNINHPSDYGFIQFHSYGYGGSSGESNALVIGVANDSTDTVVIQSPYKGGVKIAYKDTTNGTGVEYLASVLHTNNISDMITKSYVDALGVAAATAGFASSAGTATTAGTAASLNGYTQTDFWYTGNTTADSAYLRNNTQSSVDKINVRAGNSGQYIRLIDGQGGMGIADSQWSHTLTFQNFGSNNGDYSKIFNNSGKLIQIGDGTAHDVAFTGDVRIGGTSAPNAPLDAKGVRLGRDFSIANRATVRLDANGTGYPSDILFGHTAAADESSWGGVYWSHSSRGSSAGNKFYFYRGSGQPSPYNSEAVLMSFDPSMKIGVNTDSPTAHLDIQSTSGNQLRIAYNGSYGWLLEHEAATGDFTFKKDSSENFRITQEGYVGINESDPQRPLHIDSDYPQVRLQNNGDSTYMDIGCGTNYAVYNVVNPSTKLYEWRYADSAKMTLDIDGELGLGTNEPNDKIHVYGAGNGKGIKIEATTGNLESAALKLYPKSTSADERNWAISAYRNGPQDLSFSSGNAKGDDPYSSGSTRMLINGLNGYVGVGNTDPKFLLHVGGAGSRMRVGPYYTSGGDRDFVDLIAHGTDSKVYSNNERFHIQNDSGDIIINPSGKVGIKVTNPTNPLQVEGNFSDSVGVIRQTGDGETLIAEYLGSSTPVAFAIRNSTDAASSSQNFGVLHIDRAGYANGGGSNLHFRRQDANGNWREYAGIGGVIDSSVATAYTGHLDFYVSNNGSNRLNYMRLQAGGTLQVDGDVVAYSTVVPSDARLKDNVKTIDNALDKVKSLRGVEFDWNRGKKKGVNDIGLIAQEVEKVIPQVVEERDLPLMDGNEDGEKFKTVQYEKLVGVLIEAMKEQQEQIDELKRRLDGSTK